MKKNFLKNIFLLLGLVSLFACNEDDNLVLKQGQITAPNFETVFKPIYVLEKANADSIWEEISWSPVEYSEPVSVGYILQVSPSPEFTEVADVKTVLGETSVEVKVKELNMAAVEFVSQGDIYFRVVGGLADHRGQVLVDSTWSTTDYTVAFNVTTYADAPGYIFKVGSEQEWDNANDKAFPLYELEKGVFVGNFQMVEGEEFKFLLTPGSWDGEMGAGYFTAVDDVFSGDGNIIYTGETGYYQVTVNTNDKSLTIGEAVAIYKVGSENGWNGADSPLVPLFHLYGKVYRASVDLVTGEEFKFVEIPGSWDPQYSGANFPSKPQFEGDDNIKFVGEDGTYIMTANIDTGELIIE